MHAWERIRRKGAARFRAAAANRGDKRAPDAPAKGPSEPPQWVGGGKVHTPKPRSYRQDMPQKMRQAALRSALSVKAAEQSVVVLEALSLPQIKTRLMAQMLDRVVGDASALILIPEKNEEYQRVILATNNIPDAKTLLVNYLNIRDLLNYERLILPLPALDVLNSWLG